MEINTMVELISQMGFPMAMCLILLWYINKQQANHLEEMNRMSDAVNNNSLIMQKLTDKFEMLGGLRVE